MLASRDIRGSAHDGAGEWQQLSVTLFYLNSIMSSLLPHTKEAERTQSDLLLDLVKPVHLSPYLLPIVGTPECAQFADGGVQRPMQVFLARVATARGRSIPQR